MPVTRPNIITTGGNISGSGLPSDPVGTVNNLTFVSLTLTGSVESNPLKISGSTNNYLQINVKNDNAGNAASSDLVATANNGTEDAYYINMGINSTTFAGAIGGISDAYLYNTGSHLWIGNATPNKNLYFFAGAAASAGTITPTLMISASADGTAGRVGIGTNTPTAKLTVNGDVHISGSNNITFASSGQGIVFGGNALGGTPNIVGNTLNDYEEGTYTPTIAASTATFTYGTRVGRYVKIGKHVYVEIYITWSTVTAAQSISSISLPYAPSSYRNDLVSEYFKSVYMHSFYGLTRVSGYLPTVTVSGSFLSVGSDGTSGTGVYAYGALNTILNTAGGIFVTISYQTS